MKTINETYKEEYLIENDEDIEHRDFIEEINDPETEKIRSNTIGRMVQAIADGKWKYIFTINFASSIKRGKDYWQAGRNIENVIRQLVAVEGSSKNLLLVLKFEYTKKFQLHVHGIIGGKISLDATTFESQLKSSDFALGAVTSTHFDAYLPIGSQARQEAKIKIGWIPYMFKHSEVSDAGNTLYYLSKGVSQLIKQNNEELGSLRSGESSPGEFSHSKLRRFYKLMSPWEQQHFRQWMKEYGGDQS